MYSQKLPGINFWLQLKNLFFRRHPLENYSSGLTRLDPSISFPARTKTDKKVIPLPDVAAAHVVVAQNAGKWRKKWKSFITAEVDSQNTAPNGGLSNIKVQLCNKTTAPIDYIQVAVSTFEETGNVYKSEYAEVFNVAPLSSVDIPVHSSPKGNSLTVYITQVVASAFNLQYSQAAYE